MRNAMRDGGVDGVFGDVAFGAEIVVARAIGGQRASLSFDVAPNGDVGQRRPDEDVDQCVNW